MKEKAVVVCSGGLDSTVLLYHMIDGGYDPIVVTFKYGQKHSLEVGFIAETCKKLDVPHYILKIPTLPGSSLTEKTMEVPKGDYSVETQKSTVVPNRNMVFLSIAASYAIAYGAETVWYAAHYNDQAVYPDCRQDFVSMLNVALAYGNYEKIRVEAPFISMTKGDIVTLGVKLGVDFKNTWSCYDPVELTESYKPKIHIGLPKDVTVFDPEYKKVVGHSHCGVCIEQHQRVLMSDFTWKPINQVNVGDQIVSIDEFGRKGYGRTLQIAEVQKKMFKGHRDVIKIVATGHELILTSDHKILGPESYNNFKWREAGKDYKYMRTKLYCGGIDDISTYKRGWLRGLVDSDGHYSGYQYNIAQDNLELLRLPALIAEEQGFNVTYGTRSIPSSKLGGRTEIPEIRLYRKNREKLLIPYEESRDFKIGYIAGFSVGDGTLSTKRSLRIEVSEQSPYWERICGYLEDLQIDYNLQMYHKVTNLGEMDAVKIVLGSRAMLKIPILYGNYKTDRFYEYLDDITLRSLDTLDYSIVNLHSQAEVWDLQTSSGTFIAEGFVVHNCGTCRERKLAFDIAGVEDPTVYVR